jgi:hypothetical protein
MQQVAVITLVLAATVFSVWKLMPARRRLRLLMALDAWLARKDFLQHWRQGALARRIQSAGGGCAACAANTGIRRR